MSHPLNAVANNRYQNSERTSQLVNVHPSLVKSTPKLNAPITVNLAEPKRNVSPRYAMDSPLADF